MGVYRLIDVNSACVWVMHRWDILHILSRCIRLFMTHVQCIYAQMSASQLNISAVLSRSVMSDSVTPWSVACQASLSMGFSRPVS